MNAWKELWDRQQEEFNSLPLHFAFGQEQIDRKIEELKLSKDPKKRGEQIVVIGFGGFMLREDYALYKDMSKRHSDERKAAIAADETGDGFIYDMFLYELNNHEYGYTMDSSDTIEALGYTWEQIEADPRLKHGLGKAAKAIEDLEE